MAGNDTLTARQRRFLAVLLTARTVEEAADAARISRRTAYRYLADDVFKAELGRRQDEALAATTAILAGLSETAVGALRDALSRLSTHTQGSVDDFIEIDDAGGWTLALHKAEQAGLLPLVKKLWEDKEGRSRLELHDAQAAAARLGQLALDILEARRRATELDDLVQRVARLEGLISDGGGKCET